MGVFDGYVSDDRQLEMIEFSFHPEDLDRMEQALDDPTITPQGKKNFLYVLSNAGRLSDDEIRRRASEIGADADDIIEGGEQVDVNIANARDSLAKVNARDKERLKGALEEGGFSTSDEIIDKLEDFALKMFDDFHPRFVEASELMGSPVPEAPAQYTPVMRNFGSAGAGVPAEASYSHSGVDPESIRKGADEFRGIDFAEFRSDIDLLRSAHEFISEGGEVLEGAWKENTAEWTGGAKDAAQQANDNISEAADTLSQAMGGAPDVLVDCVNTIESAVVEFVKCTLDNYGDGTVGGYTLRLVDRYIDGVKSLPTQIEEEKNDWFGVDDSEELQARLEEYEGNLRGFIADYQAKASAFHENASFAFQDIQSVYLDTFTTLGQEIEPNPFAALDAANGAIGEIAVPSGMGSGAVPGVGGVPEAVPSPGGGAGAGMGGGAMPSVDDLGIDAPDMGTNPVTGEELETDPETGDPYPIDPVTGEAVKDADNRQQLTVSQGDNTFTMTEPDGEGKMSVTVEGGDGELSEYRLDFDTEDGSPDSEDLDEESFGPQGATGTDEQIYRPESDGKIHIEDAGIKITAEQPEGPDGPTVVTVDNGDGEPVTYTLGETEGQEAGPRGLGPQPSATESAPTSRQVGQSAPDAGVVGGEGGGAPGPSADASAPTGGEAFAASSSPEFHGSSEGTVDPGIDVSADNTVNESTESSGDSSSSSTTHPQAVSGGSGGTAFGGGGGGSDLGSFSDSESRGQSTPSGANLGTAPGGDIPAGMSQGGGAGSSSASGMGMMGGMGAMGGGAGGGQGGDQERTSSAYRVEGNIFETFSNTVRISGTIGDNTADVPVRFTR